jgi:DNA polymerase III psi subunit
MIDPNHLKHIITEDLYLVDDQQNRSEPGTDSNSDIEKTSTVPTPSIENEISSQETTVKLLVAAETLDETEKELLIKILRAINISENEFRLEVGSTALVTSYEKAIIFSSKPAGTFYKLSKYKNTEILSAKPLRVLNESKEEKLKLWSALKQWFSAN